MPPATLDALLDHGTFAPNTVERISRRAPDVMRALQGRKISLFDVTQDLQNDGVKLFSDSFAALLGRSSTKQKLLARAAPPRRRSPSGSSQTDLDERRCDAARASAFLKRSGRTTRRCGRTIPTRRDHQDTPWAGSTSSSTCSTKSRTARVRARNRTRVPHVVVCGMGGSSLAPDILRATFGRSQAFRTCTCSTRRPAADQEARRALDIPRTLFIISSKSGTTTEPNAFMRYFYATRAKGRRIGRRPENFVAITDPGTPLDKASASRRIPRVFDNDPDIGGRYSALSYVGIVPAAIAGYDINLLLDRGSARCTPTSARRRRERARRAFRRGDRRVRQSGPRQADDRHASPSRAFGAWANNSSRRAPANRAKASCRSKARRSASPRLRRRSPLRLRRRRLIAATRDRTDAARR